MSQDVGGVRRAAIWARLGTSWTWLKRVLVIMRVSKSTTGLWPRDRRNWAIRRKHSIWGGQDGGDTFSERGVRIHIRGCVCLAACCYCCSVTKLCPTLRDSMDCGIPCSPDLRYFLEFHVHRRRLLSLYYVNRIVSVREMIIKGGVCTWKWGSESRGCA